MENALSPSNITSKRHIEYRKSSWKVHNFEVWSGEKICKVTALSMDSSLLLWVGGEQAHLTEVALGLPQAGESLVTTLLGDEGGAGGLARRLSARLHRPVYVCCGQKFDRFVSPIVEKGIAIAIKEHPDYFGCNVLV